MVVAAVLLTIIILQLVLQAVAEVLQTLKAQRLVVQTQAAVVVVLVTVLQRQQALLVVQVTHELLIGVNYGTTLRIS